MGYPWPGLMGGTQGGYPTGVPPAGPGWGTPQLDLAGVPPPLDRQTDRWMDGKTRVKTLPSRRTTYAVGNEV